MSISNRLKALTGLSVALTLGSKCHTAPSNPVNHGSMKRFVPAGQVVSGAIRVGRNDDCICGSKIKFKKCCGKKS